MKYIIKHDWSYPSSNHTKNCIVCDYKFKGWNFTGQIMKFSLGETKLWINWCLSPKQSFSNFIYNIRIVPVED